MSLRNGTFVSRPVLAGLLVVAIGGEALAQPVDATEPPPEPAPMEPAVEEEAPTEAAPEEAEAAAPAEPAPEAPAPEAAAPEAETTEAAAEEALAPEAAEEPAPPEPSLSPVKLSASLLSRFEYRQNYDELGVSRARFQEGDSTFYRARFGVRTNALQLNEDLSALVQFTPQAAGEYGKIGTIGEQPLGLYEGYLLFQSGQSSFQVGRFAMNYGDALIIGNLEWHQSARAFEGARLHYALEKGYVDLFVTQTTLSGAGVAEGHTEYNDPLFAGDEYFWGAYAGLGPAIKESLALDLYVLGNSVAKTRGVLVDPADPMAGDYTRAPANMVTLGARLADKYEFFDYRLEGGFQFGKQSNPGDGGDTTRSVSAYQVDGDVGLSSKGYRFGIGALVASGDDPTTADENEGWNQLYPTAHKFLGLMDVIGGRSNVWSMNAKLSAKVSDATVVKVDGHLFNRMEVPDGKDEYAGAEVDVLVVQSIGAPFKLHALYGLFLPNEDHYGTSTSAHFLEVGGRLTF